MSDGNDRICKKVYQKIKVMKMEYWNDGVELKEPVFNEYNLKDSLRLSDRKLIYWLKSPDLFKSNIVYDGWDIL